MSNRLTFSLASLFLIFTMAFVPTAVMAATGGPTVTLAEYSGVDDPAAAAAGQDKHMQARDDFRVKLTFSHSVAAPAAGDVKVRLRTAGVFAAPIDASAVVEVFESGGKEYVATLAAVTEDTVTQAHVSIADDVVLGSTTNLLGNVGNSMTFTLPALIPATVKLKLEEAKPVTGTPGRYTIVAGFTNTADGASGVATLAPAFAQDYVKIVPEGAATVDNITDGTDGTAAPWKDPYIITLDLTFGTTSVNVSVDEGYIVGGNTVMVPPPVTATQNPPAAMITVDGHDPAERTYRVDVTFTPADDSLGNAGAAIKDFDSMGLDIKDASTPAVEVLTTVEAERSGDNSYTGILKYDRLSSLPLTIKIKQSGDGLKTSNPDHSAMVGMAAPTRPAAPTNVTAAADQATNMVTLTWTASAGATSYKIAQTGTASMDYTAMESPFKTPALGAGTYMFTVMASNTAGDSPASASVSATIDAPVVMVPGPPTGVGAKADQAANTIAITWTAPANDGGTAITGYMVTKHYMKDGAAATKGFSATASPLIIPPAGSTDMLPQGVSYTFTVKAMNSAGYGPDSAHSAAVMIDMDPVAPGAPTNVTATPDQAANTVLITWTAPDDGGAAITRYTINQTGAASMSYTAAASANSHTTPALGVGAYAFTVMATNSAGNSPASSPVATATINADTPVGAPMAPTGLSTTVNANNSVTLTWTEPAGAVTYQVDVTNQTTNRGNSYRIRKASAYTTPVLSAGRYLIAVAASNAAGMGDSASVQVTIAAAVPPPQGLPPTALIDSTISLPAASIGPNQFIVLQRNPADSGLYAQVPTVTVGLANLDHLLRDRGGIALLGAGSANDLVFSEIMWGSDSSLADDTHSQWIELYNTTNRTLSLSSYMLKFYSGQIGATPNAIDEINTINWGSLHGQRGRTRGEDTQGRFSEPVEIISMYLKINYPRVERSQARGEQLKDFPNGSAHGHWAASTRPSLNIESTWRLATPGAKPRFTVHGASTLRQNVIITEFGNSSEDGYDWVEIYNTTDGVINLKKWELSYVSVSGGMGKETSLFRFPDNDSHRLPGKSFLVIASTDPKNSGNDLAAGIDITKKGIDQTTKGLGTWIGGGSGNDKNINALYTVRSFKLPNGTARTNIILRHDQGKMGKASHFEDVVGTLKVELRGPVVSGWTGYDANSQTYYDTAFWPLHATGAPHGNVIDGTGDEDFRAGRVIQRNDLGKGTRTGIHEKKLSVRGWTGIGYDLDADRNNENGGTPGYHKDSLKSKASEVAGTVNISEIMIATDEDSEAGRVPRATRLPQWIELYNSSMTQGVNINNWYFEIHNSSLDRDVNLSGTLRLPNVTIPPNQTVMIVSSSGLNSGNFSEARTINLYTNNTYRSVLNLRSRGDSVLSSEGFYIELRDHENNYVDEIGNLGVTRRTGLARRDDTAEIWDIGADYLNFEGHRTSLIRVYDDRTGMARDGLLKTSWRPAAMTNFREVPSLTYYGNHRDFGTPGYRGGGPLPVELSKFRPQRLDTGEVVIHWMTESELNNAGFNILRTEKRDGVFQQVNTELIKGHGTTSERNTYTWTDTTAKPNVVYYYQIQDVSLDGQVQTLRISRLKGNVSAAGKATTTWGELKSLQ